MRDQRVTRQTAAVGGASLILVVVVILGALFLVGRAAWKTDVETKLLCVPGIEDVDVELELYPPWDPSRMSEAAKLQLGMM